MADWRSLDDTRGRRAAQACRLYRRQYNDLQARHLNACGGCVTAVPSACIPVVVPVYWLPLYAVRMSSATWIAYIDGSALPNPGRMRIGGIAYAPDGVSHCFSQAMDHTGCNNEAEALAAIHALSWLQSRGAREVLLHTDSSILAAQMAEPAAKPIARLAALYAQARALRSGFAQLEVRWVPRHKNTVADALARGDAMPRVAGVDAAPAGSVA